jgi:hypothetical protein
LAVATIDRLDRENKALQRQLFDSHTALMAAQAETAMLRAQLQAAEDRVADTQATVTRLLNEQTRHVDLERRRWYSALSWAGDLEGLAPEVAARKAERALDLLREVAHARAQGQQEERTACIEDALVTTDGNADSQRIVRAIRARAAGILSDEQCAGLEDAAKKWARVRGGEDRKETR